MAAFVPQFTHDTLLKLAGAAYLHPQQSYGPGLLKLALAAAAAPIGILAVSAVSAAFPQVPLIGRVP